MKQHSLKDWFMATRPWSYPASVMPVLAAIAYVWWLSSTGAIEQGHIKWLNGALALIAMALFQAAGNLWSDLHDYTHGVDTNESYGVKILTSEEFSPAEIRRFALRLLAAAVTAGIAIFAMSGVPTLIIGIVGLMLTLFYPHLKYNALGDLDIFLSYGILPTIGTGYVLTGTIVWPAVWLALPIGLITVAILHVNNTRDVTTDAKAHISTFAMIIGHKAAKAVYTAEILLPFAAITLLVGFGVLPVWSLLALLAVIPALKNAQAMKKSSSDNLSGIAALDAATARLQLMFSLLLSISFALGSLIHTNV